ncbi:putative pheromone processing carboxypeptidase [Talaromyces proteolyticus]|uniref:Carboxypeptidase n=1 Tax=Talaromyces proteolyticus TaxID=1131652 RepID=A0AAD4PYA2_9EURO|nr:putative pheromone processing carboxypeptidase [Talaromyces proteolyticus]KAH8694948.1 putative pheromone processing carboxypeptidase [Talaromyces proteolyticus]
MLVQPFISMAVLVAGLLVDSTWAKGTRVPLPPSVQRRYEAHYEAMAAKRATPQVFDTKDFRFLSNKTSPYRVESLPDVDFDIGEMYSGLVPIESKNKSRELFFVFQPTIGAPVDEITIWLNGGPGCSSLEGFLQENGRFVWQSGTFAPVENPYSWVNLTNMLWVDQPVGTGFSTGTPTAISEEDIAQDFVGFFKNFEILFGIKKFKIYVTGESYAGRYVPYISAAFIDQNDTEYFDLKGAMVYDPVIGAYTTAQEEVPTYPLVEANNNLFNFNETQLATLKELHQSCGYEAYLEKYLTFPASGVQPVLEEANSTCDILDLALEYALGINPCFSIYEISTSCPLQWDVLGFPGSLSYLPAGATIYFDRADVKKALHAPPNTTWTECAGNVFVGGNSGPEGLGDLSLDPIQHALPKVIEHTNRVLVSNGDYDMIIQTNGTLLAIQNMTWHGTLGFNERPSKEIYIHTPDLVYPAQFNESGYTGSDGPQGTMGIQHFERGLMWAQTYQSGHMQPEYQPRVSLRHLEWLLGRVDEL